MYSYISPARLQLDALQKTTMFLNVKFKTDGKNDILGERDLSKTGIPIKI